MTPIHDLLNRIRWDKEFAKSNFKIGYYDRVIDTIIVIPFNSNLIEEGDHYNFLAYDTDGVIHTIPFHRIKEVYRDDKLIWHREH
jgi:uncharacterized protein (UPF0248 family)